MSVPFIVHGYDELKDWLAHDDDAELPPPLPPFNAYDALNEYDDVIAYDALMTVPTILLDVTYDAVCAVVINAEAETHDAEYAFMD